MGERYRILLVEDQQALRLSLERALRFYACEVVGVACAASAQQALRAGCFDLLLCDIALTQLNDGLELARWARSRLPDVPVLLITGLPNPQLPLLLQRDPQVRLLVKPFGLLTLWTEIKAFLAETAGLVP